MVEVAETLFKVALLILAATLVVAAAWIAIEVIRAVFSDESVQSLLGVGHGG